MTLAQQALTALWLSAAGLFLAFVYHLLALVIRKFAVPRVFVAVADILYWAGAAAFVFRLLLLSGDGNVRWVSLLFLLIGAWLYYRVLHFIIRKIVVFLVLPFKRKERRQHWPSAAKRMGKK
jgi:hypothetical protein